MEGETPPSHESPMSDSHPHDPRILGTTLKVRSGKREEVHQTLTLLGDHFRAQPGCLGYLILEAPEPGPELTFLTVWGDGAAVAAHLASEACGILLGATHTLGEPLALRLPRPEAYPASTSHPLFPSAPESGAPTR